MDLIDEEGKLFGAVNVFDALAILLVVTVLIAGVALLNPLGASDTETQYATIDLGEHPSYISDQVTEGDRMAPSGTGHTITITDVYASSADGENVSVTVRAEIEGERVESDQWDGTVFEFDAEIVRPGSTLAVRTAAYELEGDVVSMASSGETLQTHETEISVKATVSASTARSIEPGDTHEIGGHTTAEITDVHVAPGPEPDTRTVVVGASLHTLERTGDLRYADQSLGIGDDLELRLSGYGISGQVVTIGTDEIVTHDRIVTLRTTLSADAAQRIEPGDTYEYAGQPVATVESVEHYATDEADEHAVLLELQLTTVTVEGTETFGTTPVRVDEEIPFEADDYNLTGTIVSRGALSDVSEHGTRTATIKMENVPPEEADAVEVGSRERTGMDTYAEVTDKHVEPASVVLESEDGHIYEREHPRNKDVYLTVDLQVHETPSGVVFHGDYLQQGDQVILDFPLATVEGTVIELRDDEERT